MPTTLEVNDAATGETYELVVEQLVVAGFTGRDAGTVAAHVEELRELNVPVPDTLPSFYLLPSSLLTTDDRIEVGGAFTSGEVEPVVIVRDEGWLLAVGSDHTDRELEAQSIHDSKAACSKPISASVLPLDRVADWDDVVISSRADGERYQHGRLADLLPLDEILAAAEGAGVELAHGSVVYLGTVPVHGSLRPADTFEVALQAGGSRLEASYAIARERPAGDRTS